MDNKELDKFIDAAEKLYPCNLPNFCTQIGSLDKDCSSCIFKPHWIRGANFGYGYGALAYKERESILVNALKYIANNTDDIDQTGYCVDAYRILTKYKKLGGKL